MDYETLRVSVDARGVAEARMNRPEKRNALSATMLAELTDMAGRLGADPAVRAVVLSGEGKSFCAGGDLTWMRAQIEADRPERMREARKLAEMLQALNLTPKPLIARVHADAFGGGVGLICVCDYVVAADSARFGLTETRLGLIPATISPYVIARMGEGPARRVFMSSRIFGAAEAQALGIASEVVAVGDLDAAVERQVEPYLSVAPGAVGRAKALARFLGPVIDDAVIDATVEHLADAWETEEARQGIDAFLERRDPPWKR